MAGTGEARLVARALQTGRWVCVAPGPGRTVLAALVELFHLETSGAAESSFLVFSTRWPDYKLEQAAVAAPLFADRRALNDFLAARRLVERLEEPMQEERNRFSAHAEWAEEKLRGVMSPAAGTSTYEAAKLRSPFRRRFTAAWCWVEALHHAVMRGPAVGSEEARIAKIRQLRLLLLSGLCISRRGRWYSELTKELLRAEGAAAALVVAAQGLAEGEPVPLTAVVRVDLTGESLSSQEGTDHPGGSSDSGSHTAFPLLPRDIRWDLARRCLSLARRAAAGVRGGSNACASRVWRRCLRETPAAHASAAGGGNDNGRWLVALAERLHAEEAAATGPIRCILATSQGLPDEPRPSGCGPSGGGGGRRLYAGYDLAELTVEELAIRHYLGSEGFDYGLHCEGALLRDLFGVLLFDELFDTSVEGVFTSAYQDAPLDLGTEAFYPAREAVLERRLGTLARLSPEELAAEVRVRFARFYGVRIRGVRWDRYEGPNGAFRGRDGGNGDEEGSRVRGDAPIELGRRLLWTRSSNGGAPSPVEEACDLGAAAGAVGGAALAVALRQLCQDHDSAGLPDLLVWCWGGAEGISTRARFVEVKSERDVLARRQRLWLSLLRGAGAEAEVCHVRDGAVLYGDPVGDGHASSESEGMGR